MLKNPQCKSIFDKNSFLVLDSVGTKYTLKLKKGMHKKWLKLSLNKQVKYIFPSTVVENDVQPFSISSDIKLLRYLHVL